MDKDITESYSDVNRARCYWLGSRFLPSFAFMYLIDTCYEGNCIRNQGKKYLSDVYHLLFYSFDEMYDLLMGNENIYLEFKRNQREIAARVVLYWDKLNLKTWFKRRYGFSKESLLKESFQMEKKKKESLDRYCHDVAEFKLIYASIFGEGENNYIAEKYSNPSELFCCS